MKRIIFWFIILVLLNAVYANGKKIIQDSDEKNIEGILNNQGIIERLKGTIGKYSPDDGLTTETKNGITVIHKTMSGDGCYNIEIQNNGDYLTLTKIFTANKALKSRENLTYNIYFDKNDEYFIKDAFVSINRENKKSIVATTATDSYLPKLKYKKNICIQYFGKNISQDSPGSRRYVYSDDKKNVTCYEIMPGDVWQKYMDATVFDFKSENRAVNIINYIILYNYDYQLGVMFFPILFDMDEPTLPYIETEITADSYLIESKVKYLPERLKDTTKGTPWVEGRPGDGIGSKIIIKGKEEISVLIISNGFDSHKKEHYYNNNRVKRIVILDLNNKQRIAVAELSDSPEPFEIYLPFDSNHIQLEIKSVYKGEKYEDTCLNYILCR